MNDNQQLAQYYQMLLAGGGRPMAQPASQQSRGNEILQGLMRLFQQPEAGDGFNFNRPMPTPNMDFMRQFAQQSQPRPVINNRIY